MTEVNFSDDKWKYTDLKFCNDVSLLQSTAEPSDDLTRLVQRKDALSRDVCKTPCPETLVGSCNCYATSSDSMTNYNKVLCAKVVDGIVIACPETCCNGGAGCPEPDREDVSTVYNMLPSSSSEPVDPTEIEVVEDKNNYVLLVIGSTATLFMAVSAFLLLGSPANALLAFILIILGTLLSLYSSIPSIRAWLKENVILQNRNGSTSD